MGKTFKDRPDKYKVIKKKPKEGRRFESTKGRKDNNLKKSVLENLENDDY